MEKITRRLFLRNTAAASAVGAAVAVPAVAEPAPTPRERLDAAITELKAAAAEIWPTADDWTIHVDGVVPSVPLMIAAYDPNWNALGKVKAYVDDGSPLLADDVTGTTEFAEWEHRS